MGPDPVQLTAKRLRQTPLHRANQPQRGCAGVLAKKGILLAFLKMNVGKFCPEKLSQPRWGWRSLSYLRSQGSREARQPWAVLRNRFAVEAIHSRFAVGATGENIKPNHRLKSMLLSTTPPK